MDSSLEKPMADKYASAFQDEIEKTGAFGMEALRDALEQLGHANVDLDVLLANLKASVPMAKAVTGKVVDKARRVPGDLWKTLKKQGEDVAFKEAFKAELEKMAMARTFENGLLGELRKLGVNKDDNYGDLGRAVLSTPERVVGHDPKAPGTTVDDPRCPPPGTPPKAIRPPKPPGPVTKPEAIEKAAEMIKEAPFKSEAQRRFMFAKHPEIAKRWAKITKGPLPEHVGDAKA
jgi:hypothetical protein